MASIPFTRSSTMTAHTLRLLVCGAAAVPLPALSNVDRCATLDAALERLATTAPPDALIAVADADDAERLLSVAGWQPLLRDLPVLLLMPAHDDARVSSLVAAGVQDVLHDDEIADPASIERRIRFAIARKRREREARKAWSTDLETGLPNRQQLIEHLSQLLALRVRQPAPMGLLVLRIDGLEAVAAQHGAESARLLRRKLAVRLRAAVRASDVVASIGGEQFALLLAKIEAPADAQRVALKLTRALREPFSVLGAAVGVVAHAGIALHPADGVDAEPLLRHAAAAALAAERRQVAAAND